MCGFVGAWSLVDGQTPTLPGHRLDAIAHRGPDGAAWHEDVRSRFGFRRLAIVDLESGQQPLYGADGSTVLMVNGEIYNHHELRAELCRRVAFRTRSDAEVVVHGYDEWGVAVLNRLRGMFGIVIADRARGRLILARDRVGKKPIYWRRDGEVIRFASEIRPLLDDAGPRIDRRALNDYLRFGYVPAPRSIFEGISKLPAGHVLVAESGRVEVRRWAPLLAFAPEPDTDDAWWTAAIRAALADAVSVRLESEVPLGFLLSGGIDSAAVFALGARASRGPVRAFTIGFTDAEVDERAVAAEVAARYGAQHEVRVVDRGEAGDLASVVARCEEPLATDALLPTDRVFSAVRSAGVTTVLAGEGSDEVFAGYAKFLPAARIALGIDPDPLPRRRPLERYLGSEEFCFPSLDDRRELIGEAATDTGFEDLEETVAGLDPLAQMLALEVALRLPDRINHRLDRLSMAWSVEARAPFMDPLVMELALKLPHRMRLRGDVRKWALREAMAGDLPASVLTARKAPFRAPDTWFVDAAVDPRSAAAAGLVEPKVVRRIRDRTRLGDAGAREQLYNLTVLHLWFQRFYSS